MNDKRCFLCKYQGVNNTETHSNEIYRSCGKVFELLLCYGHTIDLFRMGQVKFIQKHKMNFSEYFGLDEDQLIIRYLNGR